MAITEADRPPGQNIGRQPRNSRAESEESLGIYLDEIGQIGLLNKEQEVELAQSIEAGHLAQETIDNGSEEALIAIDGISHLAGHKGLSDLAGEGQQARSQFIGSNLLLVVFWSKRYQNRGLGQDDLIQEGTFGLMHAVDKFDWRKGFKFSTYGSNWIRQAIERGIANTGQTVRLPIHAQDSLVGMNRLIASTSLEPNGRMPSLEEMAEKLGLSLERAQELYESLQLQPVSLDEYLDERVGFTLGDTVSDREVDVEQSAEQQILPGLIDKAMDGLDESERIVLRLHFGLDSGTPLSLVEISKQLGCTVQVVRKNEHRAMAKLSHPSVSSSGLRDFLEGLD